MKFKAGAQVPKCAQKLNQKLKKCIFEGNSSNECIPEEGFCFIIKNFEVERIFSSAGALCTSNTPGNKVDSLPGAISP